MIASALIAAFMLAGCAAAAPKPNIEQLLATASTPSDHEAIAEYYRQEAADAHVKYEEHQAEAVRYEGIPKWQTWSWHCARLAQDYKQAEQDASVLAEQHHKIVQEIGSATELTQPVSAPGPSAKGAQ